MANNDQRGWMTAAVARGAMSRREFIQLSLAAGVSLAAANGALAAGAATPPLPKKGGTFKAAIAQGGAKDSFDPATWADQFMTDAGQIVGNGLVTIDTKNATQPDLAESYEPSDGGKRWAFKLRKGVTFHNGKSLTADDVVASFNRHRDPKVKSVIKQLLAGIADIKADGAETVVFTLTEANAEFPFAASDPHLTIFAAKDGQPDFALGIGTGPFVLDKFQPGAKLAAHRNTNYHRSEGPWFDEVELQSIPDAGARQNAVLGGQVHYADRADPRTAAQIKRRKDLRVTEVTGFGHYVAPMNCNAKPFDDVNVRQALKYAINRDEMVKRILSGQGTPGDDNPIAPAIKYATAPEPKHQYDPDKSKALLKAVGLSNLKVDLSASDAAFPGAVDAAQLIKASARKAGIEINVVKEAAETYWDLVWMRKPWCLSYWSGRPSADMMFQAAYAANAAWNDTSWSNTRFNELLKSARAEPDDAKRAAKYAEMQQILHDDGGAVVLMFNTFVSIHSAKAAHGDLNSNADHDGGQIYQRWWLA